METQPNPLTEQQLDEIETRAAAATPGPWRDHDTHLGQYGYTATVLSGEGNDTDLRAWLPTMSQTPWDETRNVWADAAFIAAVNPAVALALVADVRRLRAELASSRATVLAEVATELEGIDFHPSAKARCIDLCRLLAGRFRRKADATPPAEETPVGPRCGNNPNALLTPGDRQAVDEFKAYLARRRAGGPPEQNPFTTAEEA
jgi:hypothetical protein